jgi:hypothetical protein
MTQELETSADWLIFDVLRARSGMAVKAKLIALGKVENRSLSNFIEKILKEEISRSESKRLRGKT